MFIGKTTLISYFFSLIKILLVLKISACTSDTRCHKMIRMCSAHTHRHLILMPLVTPGGDIGVVPSTQLWEEVLESGKTLIRKLAHCESRPWETLPQKGRTLSDHSWPFQLVKARDWSSRKHKLTTNLNYNFGQLMNALFSGGVRKVCGNNGERCRARGVAIFPTHHGDHAPPLTARRKCSSSSTAVFQEEIVTRNFRAEARITCQEIKRQRWWRASARFQQVAARGAIIHSPGRQRKTTQHHLL